MDSNAHHEIKPEWHKWYSRAVWRNLRIMMLSRDPICKMCNRNASTIVDHIKPHRGTWALFCDPTNLQGLCEACHNVKTATEDGGFGHAPRASDNGPMLAPTGTDGKQFQSSTMLQSKVDDALAGNVDELLEGL